MASLNNLAVSWDEVFLFNQPLELVVGPADVLVYFEILETIGHPPRRGIVPVAWAFYRMRGRVGIPVELRLHKYPDDFDVALKDQRAPVHNLFAGRVRTAAHLRVQISQEPDETPEDCAVYGRPRIYYEWETAREQIPELVGRDVEGGAEVKTGEVKAPKPKESAKVIRPANRNCVVPAVLKAQVRCGEHGALCLRFSRDGDILAAGVRRAGDFALQFYSIPACGLMREVAAHSDLIYEVDWSCDDRLVCSASADGMVKIWRGSGDFKLKQSLAHPSAVYSARFHPQDPRLVFSAGHDGVIYLWSRVSGKLVRRLECHQQRVNSLAFAPFRAGRELLLFSADASGMISTWVANVDDGNLGAIAHRKNHRDGRLHGVPITCLSTGRSPLGLLAVTGDSNVRFIDVSVMTPTKTFIGATCLKHRMTATFSPDDRFVLAGSEDGAVFCWGREGNDVTPPVWKRRFSYPVQAVAWNPVENIVAFSSFGEGQPLLIFADRK